MEHCGCELSIITYDYLEWPSVQCRDFSCAVLIDGLLYCGVRLLGV